MRNVQREKLTHDFADDNANLTFESVAGQRNISFQLTNKGLDDVDATAQLQKTVNGTDWINEGAVNTLSQAPDNSIIQEVSGDNKSERYRYELDKVSVTVGTLQIDQLAQ